MLAFRFRKGGKAKTVAAPPEIVQAVQQVEVDEMVQVGSVVELWLPYSDSWDNNSEYDSDYDGPRFEIAFSCRKNVADFYGLW